MLYPLYHQTEWLSTKSWELALGDSANIFIVAEIGHLVLGTVHAVLRCEKKGTAILSKDAFIDFIAVDPLVRRQGIGRELMVLAYKKLADSGASSISLSMHASNRSAFRLYSSLGYECVTMRLRKVIRYRKYLSLAR